MQLMENHCSIIKKFQPFLLTNRGLLPRIASLVSYYGAIAQLGERLHGMQEVAGSIPASSNVTFIRPHRLEA